MKTKRAVVSAVCFSFICLLSAAANLFAQPITQAAEKEETFVVNELLVKYTDGTTSAAARLANERFGARVVREFPEIGWQLVELPKNLSVSEAATLYSSFAGIEFAQPNYIYKIQATPNDPSYGSLYGMTKIDAPTAWNTTTGSQNVVVAVIDTGVRTTHEDLAANMWRNPGETAANNVDDDGNGYVDDVFGYDFIRNDATPDDEYNHGTHCAGTIGAVGNNSKGVAGVNWNVRIMALKIHDATGNSTAAKIIEAYAYVRLMRLRGVNVRVTNNSYGGCNEACGFDQATKDAIDAAGDADILNIFAAGNAATNNDTAPQYPASYTSPSILAVAASNSTDAKASFSGYGATSVDLAAPGVGILSTVSGSDTAYSNFSGTSMATPHTAGAAALLAAAQPNLSAASLKASLINNVNVLANWNGIVKSNGRLNIANAINNPTVCSFNLASASQNVEAAGVVGSLAVSAAANCDFTIASQVDWINVTNGSVGSGNASINFTVAANTGANRSGTIKIGDRIFTVNQAGTSAVLPAVFDFNGDGKTDYSALQNVNGSMIWFNHTGANYTVDNFGFYTDVSVPADYDGDGKWDLAVFRAESAGAPAYFYYFGSRDNVLHVANWGVGGDSPRVVQDFDRDGRADFAVTRKANGYLYWYILLSAGGTRIEQFGLENDIPLRGDYDGDGRADLAVYRPNTGTPANAFFILKSSDGSVSGGTFGISTTDVVVPADFDGDRKTDLAVWRRTTGVWYWLESSTGNYRAAQFGSTGDLPAPGDYDGDGKTDFAVWRPNQTSSESAYFYVFGSTSGFSTFAWGNSQMRIPANTLQTEF